MESKLGELYDKIPTVAKAALFTTALAAAAMAGFVGGGKLGYHLGYEDGAKAGYEAGFEAGTNSPIRPMREKAGWIKRDNSTIDDSVNPTKGE